MASSELDGLEQAVHSLRRADSGVEPRADRGDWIAIRVGRNDVWKLTHGSATGSRTRFAKFYRSATDFRRELAGLRVARRLAEGRDWLMAAEILIADERDRFIVTESLPGMPIFRIIRAALRLGPPHRARGIALEQARRALTQLVSWVELLQVQPLESIGDLQDDRAEAVAERITGKLDRLRPRRISDAPGFWPEGLRVVSPQSGEPDVLTHGDLSFGNVFYYNGKIGIVDFENMGFGPKFRDILWVQYGLEQGNYRWNYRDSAALLGLLDAPRPDDPHAGLYRMEFVIDHLLILKTRLAARPWREQVLGLAERRWTRREFERLGRLLSGD